MQMQEKKRKEEYKKKNEKESRLEMLQNKSREKGLPPAQGWVKLSFLPWTFFLQSWGLKMRFKRVRDMEFYT